MNLIEQLGGYGNSRGLLNLYEYSISFKYYKEFDGDFESAGYIDVFIPDLKDSLLQYRRQHNIFENGDLVVDDLAPSAMLMDYGNGCEKYFILRHATPDEIKAGRRL